MDATNEVFRIFLLNNALMRLSLIGIPLKNAIKTKWSLSVASMIQKTIIP